MQVDWNWYYIHLFVHLRLFKDTHGCREPAKKQGRVTQVRLFAATLLTTLSALCAIRAISKGILHCLNTIIQCILSAVLAYFTTRVSLMWHSLMWWNAQLFQLLMMPMHTGLYFLTNPGCGINCQSLLKQVLQHKIVLYCIVSNLKILPPHICLDFDRVELNYLVA